MTTRSSRLKQRQTRLDFSSTSPSSPNATNLPPSLRHRAANITYGSSPLKRKLATTLQSDEEVDGQGHGKLATTPSIRTRVSSQPTRSSKRARRSQGKLDFSNHIGGTMDRSPSPKKNIKGSTKNLKPASGVFGNKSLVELSSSSEEEDEEDEEEPPRSSRRRGKESLAPTPTASGRRLRRKIVLDDDDDDEVRAPQSEREAAKDEGLGEPETSGDEVPRSSPTQRIRRKTRERRKPSPEFIVDDESEPDVEQADVEDDDSGSDDSGVEEDDVVITSQRRRKSPKVVVNRQEKEDLNEDLDFLKSSPPPASSGRLRSSAPAKLNERQKALEALKRRRRGETIPEESEESGTEDEEEDDDAREDSGQEPTSGHEEVGEEDFVIEDEDDPLGVPALPLQFSAQSRMKPKELFKYIVEWMVHKRINPEFEKDDEIYQLAFNRLDDEVSALAGSKYKSSAWKRDFIIALSARPKIEVYEMGASLLGDLGCQACGRTTHPATFTIRFSGKAYHKRTLENVADDDDTNDDEEDDDEDDASVDALDRAIPPESQSWSVGKFCKANAEVAHTLDHWRYHLYQWIVDYLTTEGELSRQKLFDRDAWSRKKRRKYADAIVDDMEERNQIKSLYLDFRTQVTAARDNDTTYNRGRR